MATTFLEPGGDATFDLSIWDASAQTNPTVATDFVHGSHIKSLKYAIGSGSSVQKQAVCADAGTRASFYAYMNALPTAVCSFMDILNGGTAIFVLRFTSTGALQLFSSGVQLGSTGSTVGTGAWHRISFAYTITSTTVYTFNCWVDGVSALTVTNTGTLSSTGSNNIFIGNVSGDASFDLRSSDHFIDNNASLTDIASDVWVTAKRPLSNGTTNGFTTQIGAGGSGYGSGHAPQVNERALSQTNGWSMIGAGSAVTEEYTIEGASVGDIDISAATLIDYMAWVFAKSAISETGSIVTGGTTSNIALTSTATRFFAIKGSATYPAGGTDVGIVTSTTVTTVSLYECGIIVAYTPAVATTTSGATLLLMGV